MTLINAVGQIYVLEQSAHWTTWHCTLAFFRGVPVNFSVSCDGFGLVIHQSSGPSSQLCLNGTSLLMSHVAVNVTGQFTMSLWEK